MSMDLWLGDTDMSVLHWHGHGMLNTAMLKDLHVLGYYSYMKEPNFSKMIYKASTFVRRDHDSVHLERIGE